MPILPGTDGGAARSFVVAGWKKTILPGSSPGIWISPFTEGLADGVGLVGFGIVSEAASGKSMFEQMLHLAPDTFQAVALCPLHLAPAVPDVVVVEGLPEQLM